MYETILSDVHNHVLTITLNRPAQLNAFTEQMLAELTEALKGAAKNDEVRAIVITGAGRAFCSGQDLDSVNIAADYGSIVRNQYNPMIQQLSNLEKPVIAAVNGVAAGAGFSLALACDFRIVSEKASFLAAFIHVGLVPDTGFLYHLPRIVGHAKALELAILGEKLSAVKALELGMATKLLTEENWEEEAARFAENVAKMPTKAIGLIKRYTVQSWEASLYEMLEKEAYAQRIAGQTEDHREGITAFLEKRTACFQGK